MVESVENSVDSRLFWRIIGPKKETPIERNAGAKK